MNCSQTQRLMNDLGTGRLDELVARAVQRHLVDCTDCRVGQQRALRLQQLLTVKRHETPGAHYFDNFLGNFQRRLSAELAPQPTWFQRVCAALHIEPVARMRYSFAHGIGIVFAMAMVWRGLAASGLPERMERRADFDVDSTHLLASTGLAAPHSTPRKIASALPAPTIVGSALLLPVASHADFTTPRYVLDRITTAPASYEVASIHF